MTRVGNHFTVLQEKRGWKFIQSTKFDIAIMEFDINSKHTQILTPSKLGLTEEKDMI